MKYFKPELLARCRSLDDDVAEVAAEEWERAIAGYRTRFRAIRLRLPSGARRLFASVSLHDAQILAVAFGRKQPSFTLLLRLEKTSSHPGDVLELRYHSVVGPHGGVTFKKHRQLNPKGSLAGGRILYDEFDVDEERAFFTHSLLLADGNEIDVRFHNLRVRQLNEVRLAPVEWPEADKTWPLIEV